MKNSILIPPVIRRHFFDLDKVRPRIFLRLIASASVIFTAHSAYSQFVLVLVPGLPAVSGGSVAWGDYDSDGRLDLLLSGSDGATSRPTLQLWRNTGSGFTNVTDSVAPGLPGLLDSSVAWGDFDNDGRLDFLIAGNVAGAQLWRNTGNGFVNVPVPGLSGVFVNSVAWGDYDNDGLLDFLLEGASTNGSISQLWRNVGHSFTNVPVPGLPGVAEGSLAWGDYDHDGRLDFLITGLTNGATSTSPLWRNTGSGFTNVTVPGLAGNFDSSVAWGDYDNDGRLDFLVAGRTAGGNVSQLWRNNVASSNSPSAAPIGLSATVSGESAVLSWDPPADDHTPAAGLSYNLRLGTTPGGSEVTSAPALTSGVLLAPRMGAARNGSAVFHQLKPGQTYYWSVQAVDSGFVGSLFAAEQQFRTGPLLVNPVRHANGVFEFGFTGTPGASFLALATTNLSLSLSNWTPLGTPTEISPGQFQFTDPQAPTNPQRFYRVGSL